jgi:hypothetical protein
MFLFIILYIITLIKFEDIGEYMQNYHNEKNIPFNKGNILIGSYFGKEIFIIYAIIKMVSSTRIKNY